MTDRGDKNPHPKKATDLARMIAQSPFSDALREQFGKADLLAGTKSLRDISTMSKSLTDTLKSIDIPSVRLASETPKAATAVRLPNVTMPTLNAGTQYLGFPNPLARLPSEEKTEATKARAYENRYRVTEIAIPGDLGRIVREAREARNLSQQDFADLAGVGRRFLSELENGKATLEFQKVLKVAHAAGISIFAQPR
ncbi:MULTISPECIES: helix-turn-helix transcriptional regulator [Sinorhizobium]|uniref:helix-turn-helix transcriptional regulator n=1 Tax=Sinorhizobium TaxID=28105 RepID=UPI0024B14060|nr:helix-turn-helix transcriptional regulator [Sinorhizobium terangae]WFU51969.1 helix-turn-helix transcriptional regulator [Sinorhizobium terangae]